MKIREIINDYEGEFKAIEVYESTDGKRSFHTDHIAAVDDSEWMNDDEAVDYELMDEDDYNSSVCANSSESFGDSYEEGNKVLVILVQPKKVVTYIHVSAPAPQYAINSISKIRGAISLAATRTNCYAREKEDANRLTCDIILDISCDTSNAAEVIKEAHSYLVTWNSKKIARAYLLAMTDLITMLHTPKFSKLNRRGIGKFEAIDKPAAGGVPRYFFFKGFLK